MKINTDLVNAKKFNSEIRPNLLKHSYEYRVLATLRYLYPEQFDTMFTGESPDLQDFQNRIGIEVTAAVTENDMRASRAFSSLRQCNPKEKEKYKSLIALSGYTFVPIVGNKSAISKFGTADGEKYLIQQSIRRKLNKLKNYRENFNDIGLAIILPETPTSHAEKMLPEWISETFNESGTLFNFVYVISHRFCVYYDTILNVIDKKALTSNENLWLSTIGRMTAEGELSLTESEEWL